MLNKFEKSPRDPVLISAKRTPIGKIMGGLAPIRPDDLLALTFKAVVEDSGIQPEAIDEVFAGCANQAGEDNRNIARMATLLAGLPQSVPAVTVNRLCASGLEACIGAARGIMLGDYDVCLTGGVESMSRAPFSMGKPARGFQPKKPEVYDTALGWRFPNPKMAELFPLEGMGETAENLVERHSISREEQDRFAYESHMKALEAQKTGAFDREIIPVSIPQRKGDPIIIRKDEGPRATTSLEALAKLRAVFRKGGSVTAGNSSTLNDGASAILLASREYAEKNNLTIRGTLRGWASAGVDPRVMGRGPVPAVEKLLAKTRYTVADIDIFELNEAFAAQSLAVIKELGLDASKVNLNGGAIALGHPLGCSGNRILTTMINIMERKNFTLGIATLCVGVGQGLALLYEREG